MWGSDINFIVMVPDVWIRTLYDRHRFVVRGTLAGSKRTTLTRCRRICAFRRGDRSIRGYKYKSISPKDDDGKLIGASKLATGSLEYQYNVSGKWWGAVFVDSGEAVSDSRERFQNRRRRALAVAGGADQAGYRPADRRQRRAWFTVLHRSGA